VEVKGRDAPGGVLFIQEVPDARLADYLKAQTERSAHMQTRISVILDVALTIKSLAIVEASLPSGPPVPEINVFRSELVSGRHEMRAVEMFCSEF